MKILLATHQFLPEYSAGTEVLTAETAKQLQRLGHKPSKAESHHDSILRDKVPGVGGPAMAENRLDSARAPSGRHGT